LLGRFGAPARSAIQSVSAGGRYARACTRASARSSATRSAAWPCTSGRALPPRLARARSSFRAPSRISWPDQASLSAIAAPPSSRGSRVCGSSTPSSASSVQRARSSASRGAWPTHWGCSDTGCGVVGLFRAAARERVDEATRTAAARLGIDPAEALAALAREDLVHVDGNGRPVVAYPFSAKPRGHRVLIEEKHWV